MDIMIQPIYWNLDKYLIMERPPRYIVISDIYSDPYSFDIRVNNNITTIIYPGDFGARNNFVTLYLKTGQI